MLGSNSVAPQLPTLPQGEEVASYRRYEQAQAAVDHLADELFPVELLTIVGTDLKLVERITGRLSVGRVAVSGAFSGIWFGLFIGMFMWLFQPDNAGLILVATGAVMGSIFGLLFALVPYLLGGRKRDFTSNKQVVAARYAVLASGEVEQVRQLLRTTEGNLLPIEENRAQKEMPGGAPTKFGSRLDEAPKFGVRLSDTQGDQGVHEISQHTPESEKLGEECENEGEYKDTRKEVTLNKENPFKL